MAASVIEDIIEAHLLLKDLILTALKIDEIIIFSFECNNWLLKQYEHTLDKWIHVIVTLKSGLNKTCTYNNF